MVQQSFNHGWRFFYGDPPRRHRAPLDDSEWQVISLPHDWSITLDRAASNPSTASGGFFTNGRGWYHQHLYAPMEWQDKKISLEFEGVYMNAEVWLNEHFLGRHPYGYTSFQIDLTPFLRLGEENLLRVLVDNSAQMNSRWYSGSGIYRSAWLWVRNLVHVQHYGVYITTPEVSAESALVHARTWVENETDSFQQVTLRSRIYDAAGNLVAETSTQQAIEAGKKMEFNQPIPVKTPMLWSPDTPVMYRLESDVFSAGALCDSLVTPFGIRSLHFSAEQGFLLNGQPLKLKGGCVHHDNGVLGSAAYPDSEARKVRLHKESGYNAIRCAHNPPSPAFLDACDQLGMLVIDEAFDCWKEGKNPFDYHVVFEDWWKRDIASMVCRDRNHPSVIIWSIGNEVMERDGRSEGQKIARMLADEVRTLDPTRPVTAAICGVWDTHRTWEDTDVVFAALDIGGYNYQWAKYETDHARHPLRMMMGTESFPCEAFENWESVLAHPYVIGDFVWTSMDYLGEAGIGRVYYEEEMKSFLGEYPWHQAYCGDIDLCGFKRPQSYYRDIVWGCGDPLYIAVHYPAPEGQTAKISRWGWFDVAQDWTWNGLEGKTMKVDVYSACESVELFVNGRSLGVQPAGKAHKYLATFDAPYQPGELSVVGMNGGKPVAARTVATVGAPTAIRLSADRTSLPAKDGALAYITVEVVDGQGRLNPKAGHLIRFSVTGEGLLLAVGNGNPVSTEKYVGSERSAFRGRCLAVVKASGTPGEVRIKAEADGLAGAELVLRCE